MSRSRQKGTRFESEVCEYLRTHGHPYAERRAMRGNHDAGDIAGVPGFVLECKATRELNVAGAVDEASAEAENAHQPYGVAVIKRRGKGTGQAYVVMTLCDFARLLDDQVITNCEGHQLSPRARARVAREEEK